METECAGNHLFWLKLLGRIRPCANALNFCDIFFIEVARVSPVMQGFYLLLFRNLHISLFCSLIEVCQLVVGLKTQQNGRVIQVKTFQRDVKVL